MIWFTTLLGASPAGNLPLALCRGAGELGTGQWACRNFAASFLGIWRHYLKADFETRLAVGNVCKYGSVWTCLKLLQAFLN